ncbi:hypothetical protein BJY04DRAFT_177981 [Aspergillus karnatakaensis]|uniref:uncharacterized protein n=1 Tax=Aspergillus karnatakaensis TaxID=1810916 RepID=UPI003CCD0749
MYLSVISLGLLMAGQGLAAHQKLAVSPNALLKRQGGEAFIPGTEEGCDPSLPICGTSGICYDTALGESCCPGGTWACPGGSFCLQDPYCCPDGLDPETCAEQFGITLDPTTTAEPTSTTESSSSSSSSTSVPVIPTSSETPTTTPSPTHTPTDPTDPPMHTGAANKIVGGAAALFGGLGVLGGLLV